MHTPKINFRAMTLEENTAIIKWAYFENNDSLNINKFVIEYFPKLKDITSDYSKEDIYSLIEKVVEDDYYKYETKINEEVKRYNSIWKKYNDEYFIEISGYLNVEWPKEIDNIQASVGLIPIFPRHLDTFSFEISTNLTEESLIHICAHETLHFIWFEKWKKLYPECTRREYDSPYTPWKYSEMVTDPILNSSKINNILQTKAHTYKSFYELMFNDESVMYRLKEIYNQNISIEEKIVSGFDYIDLALNNEKTR